MILSKVSSSLLDKFREEKEDTGFYQVYHQDSPQISCHIMTVLRTVQQEEEISKLTLLLNIFWLPGTAVQGATRFKGTVLFLMRPATQTVHL